ncbi:MAG TPA: hypothetical protein VK912_11455 [Longimicrobiales bacterium]|nr:hypothetical protein [Longimicrobiales bacterium]
MTAVRRTPGRTRGDAIRRKLDVTSAMSWEALVDAHVDEAMQFVALAAPYEPIEEALPRYLREMDIQTAMAAAIRTRVLTAVEEEPPVAPGDLFDDPPLQFPGDDLEDEDVGWSLLRNPQRVVRGVIRRQKRSDEYERLTQLALARAEERAIRTHIENAIGFVALLGDEPFDRAIESYLRSVDVSGGRAQAVFQRTMARLADVHLPRRSAASDPDVGEQPDLPEDPDHH